MKQMIKRFREAQQGMIALEATIGLLLFLMMMLALYSIIPLFMAQSMIGHALSESCQSMALETYVTAKLDDGNLSVSDLPISVVEMISSIGGNSQFDDSSAAFSTDERWFDLNGKEVPDNALIEKLAKARFCAYFGGGEDKTDEMLKVLGIKNGLDDLDFSGSTFSGSDLVIVLKYKISLKIGLGDFSQFESSQSVCSRLWGSA